VIYGAPQSKLIQVLGSRLKLGRHASWRVALRVPSGYRKVASNVAGERADGF
jgi:hypothetical protein